MTMKKLITTAAVAAAVATVWAPFAGAHAIVILLTGRPVTATYATWHLRVPNERTNKSTFKVTMTVPPEIQSSFIVRRAPGWKVSFTRVDTGQKDGEGVPIYKTTKVIWTALKGELIFPGMYESFEFRFKAPTTPASLCFAIDQIYNGTKKGMPNETVSWSGPPTSSTPASCVAITA
jgi:uncharacterized protein YcnI